MGALVKIKDMARRMGLVKATSSGKGVEVPLSPTTRLAVQVGPAATPAAQRSNYQKLLAPWTAQSAPLDRTVRMAINLDVPYSAIQIRAQHFGTVGAAAGGRYLIAASDDIGDCNMATYSAAATRKAFSPRRAGTEYPTLAYNGWRKVTFSGADTYGLADSGNQNLFTFADSDVIECPAVEDVSRPGQYPLLLSWHPGTGAYTRGNMTGAGTGTQYKDDIGTGLMFGYKPGDYMTAPEGWSYAASPDAVLDYILPYCTITAFSGDQKKNKSIAIIGDSRFDSTSEPAAKYYQGFAFQLEKVLKGLGVSSGVMRVCKGGQPTSIYQTWALQHLSGPNPPTVALYLAYSVNDGSPSDELLNKCRARTLEFLRACAKVGSIPVIVSLFPRASLAAGQYAQMAAFDVWCEYLGYPYFSPLKNYGDSAGIWTPGWAYDGDHMLQVGYVDMAQRVGAIAAPFMA